MKKQERHLRNSAESLTSSNKYFQPLAKNVRLNILAMDVPLRVLTSGGTLAYHRKGISL